MTVFVKSDIALPPLSKSEVLRYAESPLGAEIVLPKCPTVFPKVCFASLTVNISDNICDFGVFRVSSEKLAKNLQGCRSVLIFCATVGIGFDREITKYTRTAPSRALLVSAMGTERAEALCDAFIKEYEEENGVKLCPRFSPGYGDLSIEVQRDIFKFLEPFKKIGVSLGESLLMTPAKSVTAFTGIK